MAPDFAARLAGLLPRFAAMADVSAIALRLADTAACALGAEALAHAGENAVSRIARFTDADPGVGATVWATGAQAGVEAAAFRNAVSARHLDYNDTFTARAIVHPSDTIPAIVALAEASRIPWSRALEAISVAYETLCRLAERADLGPRGFDASSLTPLGTAAGCAWLLGLDERRSANALELAALDAATLRCVRQGRLSDWKAAASGRGAVKGMFAARLAAFGTEPPECAFEHKEGFFARVSGELDIADDAPARLPRTVLKQYPSQIFTQPMIDMAREVTGRFGTAAPAIAAVTVRAFARAVEIVGAHHGDGRALNRETADHSAAFCVAAMLAKGRLGYRDFEPFLHDADVRALMRKVRLVDIGDPPESYPHTQRCALEVELADGTRLAARRAAPLEMTSAALRRKLDDLWPADRPRAWPWQLAGEPPAFPDIGAHEPARALA